MPTSGPDESPGTGSSSGPVRRLARRLLGIPLFYKILIANTVLLAVFGAGVVLAIREVPVVRALPPAPRAGAAVALALLVGGGVNAALVALALRPLWRLQDVAERIREGDVDVRAPVSTLADRRLRELTRAFNGMLDRLAAERERRRRLAVGILRAEERARTRFARMLQDETAQRLAAQVLRLKHAEKAGSADERGRRLGQAREEAADLLEEVRRTSRALRPPELEDLGLGPALRAYARKASPDSTEVRLDVDTAAADLSAEERAAVHRILREALSNALLHSGGSRVAVRARADGPALRAEVVDDGRGFDLDGALEGEAGLGLLAMRELALDLGGELDIETAPGEGTQVRVTLPLRDGSRPATTTG